MGSSVPLSRVNTNDSRSENALIVSIISGRFALRLPFDTWRKFCTSFIVI
jgi:hypothetical protein